MLVILSDTHHSDGTTSPNPNPEAFGLLREAIVQRARDKRAQEVHLVLLGDIMDLVRTDWWFGLPPESRPWNGQIDPRTGMNSNLAAVEQQFGTILARVLDHPATRGFLRELGKVGQAQGVPPTQVTYVVGNHDRAFNNFPALREQLRRCLPRMKVGFANAFRSEAYGVAARHGHEWDDHCNARLLLQHVLQKKRRWDPLDPAIQQAMSIGEVITAELMSGLVYRVHQIGNAALAETIKGMDNLRPATEVFQWLQWQARGRNLTNAARSQLCEALVHSITGVVDSSLGRLWDQITRDVWVAADIVDRLQQVRAILKLKGLGGLETAVRLFVPLGQLKDRLLSTEDPNYVGARREFAQLDERIQFLVQGHTHVARHDYLAADTDGRVRMYLNTGTYLPLVERADAGGGFATSHQMTMAFFFRDDEDTSGRAGPGPTLDLWTGVKRKNYLETG